MALFRATALLAAALALPAQTASIIDNDQVRAAITSVAPRGTAPWPPSAANIVLIYLDPGTEKLTLRDGRVERRKFQAGSIRWVPAWLRQAGENAGSKPYRVVQVELKGQGRPVRFGPRDPVRLAPMSYKVLLDNIQVRVLRVRIGPKEGVPLHEHGLNRVVAYLTDAHLRITDAGGKATEARGKAGDVRWAGAAQHSEENLAGSPFEVVVMELK